MKKHDLETQIKEVLANKTKLSQESELALFSQAENSLSVRRKRIASREAAAHLANQAKERRLVGLQQFFSRIAEFLAIHPDAPAAATTFIALVLAFISLQERPGTPFKVSYANLPDLPKTNDFPARYDAQLSAERQAYEREVEDAHRKTSGEF